MIINAANPRLLPAMSALKLLVVGIGGVTNGGKTSLCTFLKQRFPAATIINMDDYYYPEDSPHHIWIDGMNHQDWDVVSSVNMGQLEKDIKGWVDTAIQKTSKTAIQETSKTSCTNADQHNTPSPNNGDQGNTTSANVSNSNIPMLFVEGIMIYNYKPLLPHFNKKYFFTLDKETCLKRRLGRHYLPPDKEGYFEQAVWPRYLEYKQEIDNLPDIVHLDGTTSSASIRGKVLEDLQQLLGNYVADQQMV